MTAVSWLDWKLGARLLLKYPALTIIGGLSLAAAIAIGVVGIEVAGELLYKRLPFPEGSRVVRLETQDTAASRVEPRVLHDFSIWRRSLKTVVELGAARVSERNVLTGEGRIESLRVAEITASAFPLTRVPPLARQAAAADGRNAGCGARRGPGLRRLAEAVPAGSGNHRPRRDGGSHGSHRGGRDAAALRLPAQSAGMGAVAGPGRGAARGAGRAGVRPPRRRSELAGRRFGARTSSRHSLAASQPTTHTQLRTRVRAFAGRTPRDPLRFEDLALHAVVLLLLGAISANVATLIFARTAMREPEMVVRHALGASRARVVAQIVTEGLVLALAAAVLGLIVAQTTVRYAWAQASQQMGDGLPFWVDLRLEPATIAYALLLALVAAVLISLLPALKATGGSVLRGLQGITSTGGTMKFGGIWSFIVGAQVACTLLFVPAAVGIYTTSVQNKPKWTAFPTERYLTFRLRMDNEALAGEQGVPDDGQIGVRRAPSLRRPRGPVACGAWCDARDARRSPADDVPGLGGGGNGAGRCASGSPARQLRGRIRDGGGRCRLSRRVRRPDPGWPRLASR